MRSVKLLLTSVLMLTLLITCSKKDDNPTGPVTPPDGDDTTPTSFMLVKRDVFNELPNSVVMLLQVTDLEGKGVDFLTVDRFQVTEEGVRLSNTVTSAYILKKADLNYTVRTRILIDNNTGTNLAVLKKGALQLIQAADPQQEFAVCTFDDQYQVVLDYTSDTNALTGAINGITEGNAACNLYGALLEAKRDRDEYSTATVIQHTYAIFTDSNDNVGVMDQSAVGPITSQVKFYTVGFGNVDGAKLDDIGTKSYFAAADEAAILLAGTKVENAIKAYAGSLYRVAYRSSLRHGSNHTLELTISGNTNLTNTAKLEDTFDSSPFVDVPTGLYINWSYATPDGIDLVLVSAGGQRTIVALSMGGTKVSSFRATVVDQAVASATISAGGRIIITSKGADGDSTKMTITDTANNTSKEVTLKLVHFKLGTVLFEKWNDFTGTSIASIANDPRYPNSPTVSAELVTWEIEDGVGDNYATRVRGYLHPPVTGKYNFYISSDDQSQLFLSTDSDPANKVKVCEVTGYTNVREWAKEGGQKSDAIFLQAGKHYYIESLHREGTGGDNLAVAWALESATREIITGDYLSLWEN